ncbi:MAG: tetratricopeptide repeat protein [Sphingomonadales bacterium]
MRLVAATLLLLPAAPLLAAPSDPVRYRACLEIAPKDPARAMQMAYAWRIEGGGAPSRHCLAVAQMHARHYDEALKSYEAAGEASEAAKDGQSVALWRQAGEAAMIADKPEAAVGFLGRALSRPAGAELSPRAEADLLTSRAEALVATGKPDAAMADLSRATALSPDYMMPWLLKATLARRSGDLAAAEAALVKAAGLAPESPDVELEAGNIAAAKGDVALAKQAYEAALGDGPDTPAGQAAAAALGKMSATLPEKPLTKDPLPATPR